MIATGQNRNQQPVTKYQSDLNEVPSVSSGRKALWIAVGTVLCLGISAAAVIPVLTTILYTTTTTTMATTATTVTTTTTTTATTTTTTTTATTATTTTTTTAACLTTYSQSFTGSGTPSSQCTAWTTFTAGLTCGTYSVMRIYGSNNPVGITITSSAVATAIAVALRTSGSYSGSSNGYTWAVGACGSGSEISSTGGICQCTTGYTIRPCIGNSNWGGINSGTCGGGTQTMSLYFA